MNVEWKYNKRILFISSGDDWTWDDASDFLVRLREMLQDVSHPVQIVKHFRPEFRLPPGGFHQHMQREVQLYNEMNIECVYYAGSPAILTLMQTAIQRNSSDMSRYIMLNNLDDALQRARNKADGADLSDAG
jgi:hypothetical protein